MFVWMCAREVDVNHPPDLGSAENCPLGYLLLTSEPSCQLLTEGFLFVFFCGFCFVFIK